MGPYADDSFFTLTLLGRIGLLSLSALLAAVALLLSRRIAYRRPLALRLMTGVCVAWMFVWVSPQIYYLYYLTLFDIPLQWVIDLPPSPWRMLQLLGFAERATLSAHSLGILCWGCILLATARNS